MTCPGWDTVTKTESSAAVGATRALSPLPSAKRIRLSSGWKFVFNVYQGSKNMYKKRLKSGLAPFPGEAGRNSPCPQHCACPKGRQSNHGQHCQKQSSPSSLTAQEPKHLAQADALQPRPHLCACREQI